MSNQERRTEFYSPEEIEALEAIGRDRRPSSGMEDRVVGVLRRRGLLETTVETRSRGGFLAFLSGGLLKPALVGAAVAGAFLLGRALEHEPAESTLLNLTEGEIPGYASDPAVSHADPAGVHDAVPRRLVVLGSENREFEYYVDAEGQNYYVLVKLPIPTPIAAPSAPAGAVEHPAAHAQSVPSMRNNQYDYYFDTHGNAYGVVARDHPAADLFATR